MEEVMFKQDLGGRFRCGCVQIGRGHAHEPRRGD